jgi:hypothetical protein
MQTTTSTSEIIPDNTAIDITQFSKITPSMLFVPARREPLKSSASFATTTLSTQSLMGRTSFISAKRMFWAPQEHSFPITAAVLPARSYEEILQLRMCGSLGSRQPIPFMPILTLVCCSINLSILFIGLFFGCVYLTN